MGLIYLLTETKNCFILTNSCNLLTWTRDLLLEPIHKRQLIPSQDARISFFYNIPNDESYLNLKVSNAN